MRSCASSTTQKQLLRLDSPVDTVAEGPKVVVHPPRVFSSANSQAERISRLAEVLGAADMEADCEGLSAGVDVVEPSNKGHLGSRAFVLFSEVVLWWEVGANMQFIAPSRPNIPR